MTEDWNRFLSVVQTDREGSRLNLVKVDGVDSTDEKVIGKRLQEIAKNATTGGLYKAVGELYGFPIKVVSERTLKEGLEFTDNRFVVEGNYKYTYNNGASGDGRPDCCRTKLSERIGEDSDHHRPVQV